MILLLSPEIANQSLKLAIFNVTPELSDRIELLKARRRRRRIEEH